MAPRAAQPPSPDAPPREPGSEATATPGMDVGIKCPGCEGILPVRAADGPDQVTCGRCGHAIELEWSAAVANDTGVDRCPLCTGQDFYLRKDFDPRTGVAVVAVGALISAAFYWFGLDLIAYGVLAGAALLDLVIYGRLGDVTVCYRCHTEFRGSYPRTAPAFDLHTADVLEHEYARARSRRRRE